MLQKHVVPSRMDPTPELWDDELTTEQETVDVLRRVHSLLIRHFPSKDLNCGSPVALGYHLAAACWHKDNIKVPPAPEDIRDLLRQSSPQGRHEIRSEERRVGK